MPMKGVTNVGLTDEDFGACNFARFRRAFRPVRSSRTGYL
jgi:hypothetical protein